MNKKLTVQKRIDLSDSLTRIKEAALNGEIDSLEAYIFLQEIAKVAEDGRKKLVDAATEEANKFGRGEFEYKGKKVLVKGGAGRYSYKHIQEWVHKKEELKEIEKQAQAAYKAVGANGILANKDSGEVIPAAEYTHGSEIVTIYEIKNIEENGTV
jgi:undecaprenyl pyrophosphate synthase